MDTNTYQAIKASLVSALVCWLVYFPALSNDFINWDDYEYILNNPLITSLNWAAIVDIFSSFYLNWWIPLTWLSFAFDYSIWGLDPFGYHLTNITLHAINAGLVVLIADMIFRNTTVTSSVSVLKYGYFLLLLITGLLFGLHPLRVESVAWATERKDVLSGCFVLGTVYFYIAYLVSTQSKSSIKNTYVYYFTSVCLFIMSLMAKPIGVVLPIVLLIVDIYPFKRLHKQNINIILLEKVPYIIASLAITVITILLSIQDKSLLVGISILQRFAISGNAIFEYCRIILLPLKINPIYIIPYDFFDTYMIKAVCVVLFSFLVIIMRAKIPAFAAAWSCFIVFLFPTLAFTQNGMQAFAARFTYLPSVSLTFFLVGFFALCCRAPSTWYSAFRRPFFTILTLIMFIWYTASTNLLIDVWKNSASYWTRVITIQPFDAAYYYRGLYFFDSGNYQAAIRDFTVSLTAGINSRRHDIFNLYVFRGRAWMHLKQYDKAVMDLTAAIELYPHPTFYFLRGVAFSMLGEHSLSKEDFNKSGIMSNDMR